MHAEEKMGAGWAFTVAADYLEGLAHGMEKLPSHDSMAAAELLAKIQKKAARDGSKPEGA